MQEERRAKAGGADVLTERTTHLSRPSPANQPSESNVCVWGRTPESSARRPEEMPAAVGLHLLSGLSCSRSQDGCPVAVSLGVTLRRPRAPPVAFSMVGWGRSVLGVASRKRRASTRPPGALRARELEDTEPGRTHSWGGVLWVLTQGSPRRYSTEGTSGKMQSGESLPSHITPLSLFVYWEDGREVVSPKSLSSSLLHSAQGSRGNH